MHVIVNGEPLEEVDCFKYLGLQVVLKKLHKNHIFIHFTTSHIITL